MYKEATAAPPQPRSGDLLLRLAAALQALTAAASRSRGIALGVAPAAALVSASPDSMATTAASTSTGADAMTTESQHPARGAQDIAAGNSAGRSGDDVDDGAVTRPGAAATSAATSTREEDTEMEMVVRPMEELALEPPALAAASAIASSFAPAPGVEERPEAAAAASAVVAAVEMAVHGDNGDERDMGGNYVDGEQREVTLSTSVSNRRSGSAAVGRQGGVEKHLDLVLEALVRVRGIVTPHFRCASTRTNVKLIVVCVLPVRPHFCIPPVELNLQQV